MIRSLLAISLVFGSANVAQVAFAANSTASLEAIFSSASTNAVNASTNRTIPCASGGPVSESFYEYAFKQCYSHCPQLCQSNSTVSGNYYRNGYYKIECGCHK